MYQLWGTLRVRTENDLHRMCQNLSVDLSKHGLRVSYKRLQLPESYTPIIVVGCSLQIDQEGLNQKMLYHMKKTETKMADNQQISSDLRDKPLPTMQWYVKGFREGSMTAEQYKKYGLKNNFKLEKMHFEHLSWKCLH